jgi:hypothetical protein
MKEVERRIAELRDQRTHGRASLGVHYNMRRFSPRPLDPRLGNSFLFFVQASRLFVSLIYNLSYYNLSFQQSLTPFQLQ